LVLYIIYAPAIPAFVYQLGVNISTEESAENITERGTVFWYGFAFGDWDYRILTGRCSDLDLR
jgi:hypothetical protein